VTRREERGERREERGERREERGERGWPSKLTCRPHPPFAVSQTASFSRLACLSYRLLARAAPPPGPTRRSVDERLAQQVFSALCV
jgi:hypothetical protein